MPPDDTHEEAVVSNGPWIRAVISDIFPAPAVPRACPRGHLPSLHWGPSDRYHEADHWYACSRWFGLRPCCTGPVVRDSGKYAQRKAAAAWNKSLGTS